MFLAKCPGISKTNYCLRSDTTCGNSTNMGRGFQKTISVKLYPEEIQACEIISNLAGWSGKSHAMREFMKIWIEAAVVTIDSNSPTRGTVQIMKSMQRLQKQMREIQKNTEASKGDLLHEHDVEILRKAIA